MMKKAVTSYVKKWFQLPCCPAFIPAIGGAVYPEGLAAIVKESKAAGGESSSVNVGPAVVKVSKSNLIAHISEKKIVRGFTK